MSRGACRRACPNLYHDQGQIATKLRGFNHGVTVTAGLEAGFTTPSHGTAFDIVRKGIANTGALESAIRLAAQPCGLKPTSDTESYRLCRSRRSDVVSIGFVTHAASGAVGAWWRSIPLFVCAFAV